MNVLDLIGERYLQLRQICEQRWNEIGDLDISNSEWVILGIIYNREPTSSYISKHVGITRQAAHKLIKSLESKGLVVKKNMENNKKVKVLQLTEQGNACCETYQAIKEQLELKIGETIGPERLAALKEALSADWELD